MTDIDQCIEELLHWADQKIEGQQEPPWSLPEYKKLREALAAIKAGREATMTLEDSRQFELNLGSDHQQVENIVSLDTLRLHRGLLHLQMPM